MHIFYCCKRVRVKLHILACLTLNEMQSLQQYNADEKASLTHYSADLHYSNVTVLTQILIYQMAACSNLNCSFR